MENKIRCYGDIVAEVTSEQAITDTISDQIDIERMILKEYKKFEKNASVDPDLPILYRQDHIKILKNWLRDLPRSYECLDASRPWLIYWILHSLWLLNGLPDLEIMSDTVQFLKKCQHQDGGYGGGPGQYPHLGTTYAAINALSIIGTEEAYDSIDRSSLQKFLWTVREVNGAFSVHKNGEQDIRGAYCAISVAKITNTYTEALFDKTAEWIVSCQTYEGGFAGYPGMEAHGGYTFCGIASLAFLNKTQLCDIDALLRWCANRQMRLEGGFQGRTNKLVDGCYSFWQGAVFPIISVILSQDCKELIEKTLFNQGALQEYILICCQEPNGGLIDKPGKMSITADVYCEELNTMMQKLAHLLPDLVNRSAPLLLHDNARLHTAQQTVSKLQELRHRDIYHTCYALSGLSVAQHGTGAGDPFVVGSPRNELNRIHPLHNIAPHFAYNALHYFIRHPPPVKDTN